MQDICELSEVAILAYRNGRYTDAIELFTSVLDVNPGNWMARLYLGMSYEKTNRCTDAQRIFRRIATECPDEDLKVKAEGCLPLVEAEMRRKFAKDKPAKPQERKQLYPGYEEIAWIG